MCTVVVQTSPFFLLSNRDEFLDRPAAPLDHWEGILAGRDLRSGGAWLGFAAQGRWAVLTNIPGAPLPTRPHAAGWCKTSSLATSLPKNMP